MASSSDAKPGSARAAANERFVGLDGIRGLAAIAVMLHHTRGFTGFDPVPGAYLAVDLFFALSGFVIAGAYGSRLKSSMGPGPFFVVRLIRLYPLYLLGLALGLAAFIGMTVTNRGELPWSFSASLVLSLFLLPAFGAAALKDGTLFPFNGPSWSLFLELLANAAYGVIARFLSVPRLLAIVGLSAGLLVLVAVSYGSLDQGAGQDSFVGGLVRVCFSFFAGVLLFHLHTRLRAATGLLALAIVVLSAVLMVFDVAGGMRVALDLAAAMVVFPVLILVLARTGFGTRVAEAFKTLGLASYALYAIHLPCLALATGAWKVMLKSPAPPSVILLLFCPMIAVAALVVTKFFDEPVRRRVLNWAMAGRLEAKARPPVVAP